MDSQFFRKELKSITKQIIEKYKPEKIILFGSLARGDFNKDSDIDLLIIKKTSEDRIRRIQRLSSLIDRRFAFEPLILTPEELSERLKLGDFFFEEILKEGKMLYGE